MKNPHVTTFVAVTKVDTSADLHHAKVSISLIASDEEKIKVVAALQSAAGFIAVHAAKKVQLRYFPNLTFRSIQALKSKCAFSKSSATSKKSASLVNQ